MTPVCGYIYQNFLNNIVRYYVNRNKSLVLANSLNSSNKNINYMSY